MPKSQNGYTANDRSVIDTFVIPGTRVGIALRRGPTATVLLYVLSQFDQRVENLGGLKGQVDDWGYAERPIRGSLSELSNHASGTAADANATRHPLGSDPSDNFTPAQIREIHHILAEVKHVVRWGGDYSGRKDGMHFEIVADLEEVKRAVSELGLRPDGTRNPPTTEQESIDMADLTPKQRQDLINDIRDAVLGAEIGKGENRMTIAQAIGRAASAA